MKINNNKKGFTIVELVIVVAVIGILAAVLIPTFVNLTNKANKAADDSLVKNLNTALSMQEQLPDDPENVNFHEAVIDLDNYGYKITSLITKSDETLLWNSKTNRFLLEENIGKEANASNKYEFWKISNTFDNSGYSIYAGNDFNEETAIEITNGVGFDVGYKNVPSISYTRGTTDDEHDVVIRTNSYDTNLTIDAATDTVRHYGSAGSLNIIAVKGESYHEFGKAAFAEIKTGRIVLESESKLDHIHLTKTNENFVDITIAKASNVEMPVLSRDPVEIPSAGKLVVVLQNGTNKEDAKDYVWLTAVGIYEQVTVSSSKTDAGTNYAATSSSVAEDKKEAASQIANNITATVLGYDYTVRAEKVGNDWVYTLEGETPEETAVVASYDISVATETSEVTVMNGLIPVPVTTTVDNGIDEEEKDSIKDRAINEEKGNIYFTASIQDIGANYYINYTYIDIGDTYEIDIDSYSISCDIGSSVFGVNWESTDTSIADLTIEAVYYCGFDEYTQEEYDALDDEEKEECEPEYSISVNGKSAGSATITITYYDLEDETNSVDYTYHIFVAGTQVKIGETVYNTLEAAVASAQSGDTIKLFENIGAPSMSISTGYLPGITYGHDLSYTTDSRETQLTGVKDLILDLNGYSINSGSLNIYNTNLEIIDSSSEKTGVINAPIFVHFDGNTASFTWNSNSGTYEETGITYDDPTVVTFTGGTIKQVNMYDYTKVVVDGSQIVNSEVYVSPYVGYGFGVGAYASINSAQIEIKSGIVSGTETDIKVIGPNNTVTITGGAFKYNPSEYVDTEHYNVAPNADGSLWTVFAK